MPVICSPDSNAAARASSAGPVPSVTRLGTSIMRSIRKLPASSSTVTLFFVPPLSIPTIMDPGSRIVLRSAEMIGAAESAAPER